MSTGCPHGPAYTVVRCDQCIINDLRKELSQSTERAAQDTLQMRKLADRVKELEDHAFEMSAFNQQTTLMYREQMSETIEAARELLEEIDSQAEMGGPTFDGSDPLKAALNVFSSPGQMSKVSPDNIAHEFAGPEAAGVHMKGAPLESSAGREDGSQPAVSTTAQVDCPRSRCRTAEKHLTLVLEKCERYEKALKRMARVWVEKGYPEESTEARIARLALDATQVTVTNQVSNEGQEVHFNHPRLGISCACPKCVSSNA